jgi:2-oxoglutarate ferredoxin oxidoreductase subunit beta
MAELLSVLQTPGFITRQAVIKPKYILRAKKAIKRAFEYQLENRCFSFVELISTCPTNWGLTPVEAVQWAEETMLPYYRLGDCKTPEPSEVQ